MSTDANTLRLLLRNADSSATTSGGLCVLATNTKAANKNRSTHLPAWLIRWCRNKLESGTDIGNFCRAPPLLLGSTSTISRFVAFDGQYRIQDRTIHEIWSVDYQANRWNYCHRMSPFKAKMHQIRFLVSVCVLDGFWHLTKNPKADRLCPVEMAPLAANYIYKKNTNL